MTTRLTGILTDVFPIETRPNFTKKVFWIKQPDTERNPQHWELELHGKDTERLRGINIGDFVECEVEVRGRKYKRRDMSEAIFTTLKCVGMLVVNKLESAPGYKPIKKKGREPDEDRPQPQAQLPL